VDALVADEVATAAAAGVDPSPLDEPDVRARGRDSAWTIPTAFDDRAVPGRWEGDLIIGGRSHSAIATLVERQTRYVMLIALPAGRSAPAVRDALAARILDRPSQLRRTLTWDRGHEMAEHVRFTVDTGVVSTIGLDRRSAG
jgi:IS30 family transposase